MKGFTLIETLIAVLVLGLVVTASLKLVALSHRGLAHVREKEHMLDEASRMQIALTTEPTNIFGISGDISWTVQDMKEPLWIDTGIDIASLSFGASADQERIKEYEQLWRELEIVWKEKTAQERTITIFLPYSEEAAAASQDLLPEGR